MGDSREFVDNGEHWDRAPTRPTQAKLTPLIGGASLASLPLG